MIFELNEVVKILEDNPNQGVKRGDIGTITMIYETPNKAYEVEIVDEKGRVKFQGVYYSNQIAKIIVR